MSDEPSDSQPKPLSDEIRLWFVPNGPGKLTAYQNGVEVASVFTGTSDVPSGGVWLTVRLAIG